MTTPEENMPKTRDTDQELPEADDQAAQPPRPRPTLGAELEDKMRQTGVEREDFSEE